MFTIVLDDYSHTVEDGFSMFPMRYPVAMQSFQCWLWSAGFSVVLMMRCLIQAVEMLHPSGPVLCCKSKVACEVLDLVFCRIEWLW